MEIKDNTALFKKSKQEKPKCRTCGDIVEHSRFYDRPTFDCLKSLQTRLRETEDMLKEIATTEDFGAYHVETIEEYLAKYNIQ